MMNTIGFWATILGLPFTIVGAWFGWKALRKSPEPKRHTINRAVGGRSVRQSGGIGATENYSDNSTDVTQTGGDQATLNEAIGVHDVEQRG